MAKKNIVMHKKEFIESVAANGAMTKKDAEKAIDAVVSSVMSVLDSGVGVQLVGFGTFSVVDVDARIAHNPKTGEKVKVPAKKKPVFKFSNTYKKSFEA